MCSNRREIVVVTIPLLLSHPFTNVAMNKGLHWGVTVCFFMFKLSTAFACQYKFWLGLLVIISIFVDSIHVNWVMLAAGLLGGRRAGVVLDYGY